MPRSNYMCPDWKEHVINTYPDMLHLDYIFQDLITRVWTEG